MPALIRKPVFVARVADFAPRLSSNGACPGRRHRRRQRLEVGDAQQARRRSLRSAASGSLRCGALLLWFWHGQCLALGDAGAGCHAAAGVAAHCCARLARRHEVVQQGALARRAQAIEAGFAGEAAPCCCCAWIRSAACRSARAGAGGVTRRAGRAPAAPASILGGSSGVPAGEGEQSARQQLVQCRHVFGLELAGGTGAELTSTS